LKKPGFSVEIIKFDKFSKLHGSEVAQTLFDYLQELNYND